jgi:hypothetical protein
MSGAHVKIRSRKFNGRCGRHKRYNPAIDGQGGIRGACPRCHLLLEIWETGMRLNQLIRRFDPALDDLEQPKKAQPATADPRQMSLID